MQPHKVSIYGHVTRQLPYMFMYTYKHTLLRFLPPPPVLPSCPPLSPAQGVLYPLCLHAGLPRAPWCLPHVVDGED